MTFELIGKYDDYPVYDVGDNLICYRGNEYLNNINIFNCKNWKMPFGKYKGIAMMDINDTSYMEWLWCRDNLDNILKDKIRFCLDFGYSNPLLGIQKAERQYSKNYNSYKRGYSGWNTYYGDEILDASDLC